MKFWAACLLVLAGSVGYYIYACGPMYPDEVRFSIFKPGAFKSNGFDHFNYSNRLFSYPAAEEFSDSVGYTMPDQNLALWKKYCDNKCSEAEIELAVYKLTVSDIESDNGTNGMIRYLKKTKKKSALDYLAFAKECEEFNTFFSDPWERDESKGDFRIPHGSN